jgi:hypothetical protein
MNVVPRLLLCTLACSAHASLIYVESGGVVSGEAELFDSRTTDGSGRTWLVVPGESAGAGTLLNPRGGAYIQNLPDSGAGGSGPLLAPEIRYPIQITTLGTYRLFMRFDANLSINSGGNSDSMFIDLVELKDGTSPAFGTGSNLHADWYQMNPTTGVNGGDFALDPWRSDAAPEVNAAGAVGTPPTWTITTPGTYTLRFTPREDGIAVDAWVLQLSDLTAPTGDGPPVSLIIPEPGTAGLFALGALALRRLRCRA